MWPFKYVKKYQYIHCMKNDVNSMCYLQLVKELSEGNLIFSLF